MPKQVNGFLAEDGTFFENEPECKRYENAKFLETLCETHNLNYENFMATINAWHEQIRNYFDADNACQIKQTKQDHTLNFEPRFINDAFDGDTERDGSFPPIEGDQSYAALRDKNSPGFLEQSIRRHK